jgi:tRNA-splicing ligase RtcB
MDLKDFGFLDIDHKRFSAIGKPYKIYAELLDSESQTQFENVLKAPFVTKAALMPDAHSGYTMPIGAVCATKDVIVPQFVGFDIGCGMCAYKSDFYKDEIEKYSKEIYDRVVSTIPLGFNTHKNHQPFKYDLELSDFAKAILNSIGLKQLGTLGGGNHFIEIGYGKDDRVWIVIHSGSRGFGHKIASHYMVQSYLQQNPIDSYVEDAVADWEARNQRFKEANIQGYEKALKKFTIKKSIELNKKLKPDNIKGIYGLDVNSKLGKDYIMDQKFALNFALENRKRMIEGIHNILNDVLNKDSKIDFEDEARFINKNHNHAEYDEKSGEWIHRKGATHASKGMMGVIPGNMRDGSFVVRGKGNIDSLESSSHGAGRVMSRVKAKKSITLDEFENAMQGVVGTIDTNTIDESPFAYKDIFEVMKLQADLVDVVEHIKPLINVKDCPKQRY